MRFELGSSGYAVDKALSEMNAELRQQTEKNHSSAAPAQSFAQEETPEHDKAASIQPLSQAIGEFIEWCGEQGIFLARNWQPDGIRHPQTAPILESTEQILARHFDIDLKALERERRALLEAQRALNATVKSRAKPLNT